MFKKSKLASASLAALGGALLATSAPAWAQAVERVEITGSLIKRTSAETALPVTVLRVSDLAASGATNAEQVVNLLSQNQSATVSSSSVGSSTGGAAYASLRGLGASRTLVLLNGKRLVNNPYSDQAVDLNTIPLVALDRVEVLTDGASAVYGTDAVAGVINFITKRDFKGGQIDVAISKPQRSGGGDTKSLSLGGGIGSLASDGWNVFGGVSWRKFEPLKATDRTYARTAYIPDRGYNRLSPTTYPANYTQGAISSNPTLPNCLPPFSLNVNGADCRFDFVPFINIVPEQEQKSALVRGAVLVAGQSLSLEFVRAENEIKSIISPTPITGLTMTSANPSFPGGSGSIPAAAGLNQNAPISLNWRTSEVGGRASNPQNTSDRVMLQLSGAAAGIDYEVYGLQAQSTVRNNFIGGYVNRTALQNGLNGTNGVPYLNPFGAQSAQGLEYLNSIRILGEVQRAKGKVQQIGAQASMELFKLPAGAVTLALAADSKKEENSYINNFALIRQAASSGLELAQDSVGSRTASGVASELSIPVMKSLEVGVALRADHYSDFGNTTNPKVSLRFQPTSDVLVRGSLNTGFKAPTLQQIYQPNYFTNTASSYNDPVLCPGGVLNTAQGGVRTRDCSIQFQRQLGGSKTLKPEESRAWTVGLVLQPSANFSLGADYWNYVVKDTLGNLASAAIFGDPVKYAGRFVRCSAVDATTRAALAACNIPGGDPLAYTANATENLGNTKTSGVDVTSQLSTGSTAQGRFAANYRGTFVTKYQFQREKGGAYFNNAGVYFDGGAIFRYTHFLTFTYDSGPFSGVLTQNYKRGYVDCNSQCNIGAAFANEVQDYETWDLSVSFKPMKNLTLSLGVQNVFNVDPPFTNKTDGFQAGFDERYTSALGRTFTLRAGYKF